MMHVIFDCEVYVQICTRLHLIIMCTWRFTIKMVVHISHHHTRDCYRSHRYLVTSFWVHHKHCHPNHISVQMRTVSQVKHNSKCNLNCWRCVCVEPEHCKIQMFGWNLHETRRHRAHTHTHVKFHDRIAITRRKCNIPGHRKSVRKCPITRAQFDKDPAGIYTVVIITVILNEL